MESKYEAFNAPNQVAADGSCKCIDCHENLTDPESLNFISRMFTKNQAKCCFNCHAFICSKCADQNCIVVPPGGLTNSEDIEKHYPKAQDSDQSIDEEQRKQKVKEIFNKHNIQGFCSKCYHQKLAIDMTRTYDTYGAIGGAPVVFAHSTPCTRMMCSEYAKQLSNAKGYRCYAFDFPGHGSRYKETCNLETCMKVLRDIAELAIKEDPQHRTPLFVGYAFGGYVGFKTLATYPELFCAAIYNDCGIDFGPGKNCGASFGMKMMRKWLPMITNKMITEALMGSVPKKGKSDVDLILKTVFQAGIYFQPIVGVLEIFETVNVAECIPKFKGPILFLNGCMTCNSEPKWIDLCANKERSKTKNNNNLDAYFAHDHLDDFVTEAVAFYEIEQHHAKNANNIITAEPVGW